MALVLTASEMQKVDTIATRKFSIPGIILMENAGRCVIEKLLELYTTLCDKKIFILCGKGNNGGDGLVAARYAFSHCAKVTVALVNNPNDFKGNTKIQYNIISKYHPTLEIAQFQPKKFIGRKFDIIIDAIFGTSFNGNLEGKYRTAVEWINSQKENSTIVAVDVPSGLNATTGEVNPFAVKADYTVTMAVYKQGLLLGKGKEFSGEVQVADIHIPSEAIAHSISSPKFLVQQHDVILSLPHRPFDAHKHSVGKIFILAGAKSFSGAALLCSQSAMKSGAGSVILGVPDAIFSSISKRTLEVMPLSLPSTPTGSLAKDSLSSINRKIAWSDVVLLGPGLSQESETQEVILNIIKNTSKPIVIDADGLNALVGNINILHKRKSKSVILTPHLGEFSRLVGKEIHTLDFTTMEVAKAFAIKNKVTLVLKGAPTIVVTVEGKIFFNSTGNSGMATAGSGDVLAGIIVSFIGQGNAAPIAASNAVYVHGKAGDLACIAIGTIGMVASDIINYIPQVLKSLQKNK